MAWAAFPSSARRRVSDRTDLHTSTKTLVVWPKDFIVIHRATVDFHAFPNEYSFARVNAGGTTDGSTKGIIFMIKTRALWDVVKYPCAFPFFRGTLHVIPKNPGGSFYETDTSITTGPIAIGDAACCCRRCSCDHSVSGLGAGERNELHRSGKVQVRAGRFHRQYRVLAPGRQRSAGRRAEHLGDRRRDRWPVHRTARRPGGRRHGAAAADNVRQTRCPSGDLVR